MGGRLISHGQSSRFKEYLPKFLDEKFEKALNDVDLLSLVENIALVESKLDVQLETLGQTGHECPRCVQVKVEYDKLLNHLKNPSSGFRKQSLTESIQKIGLTLDSVGARESVLHQINQTIDRLGRLKETETRRREKEQEFVALDVFEIAFISLFRIIFEELGDVNRYVAIARRAELEVLGQHIITDSPAH